MSSASTEGSLSNVDSHNHFSASASTHGLWCHVVQLSKRPSILQRIISDTLLLWRPKVYQDASTKVSHDCHDTGDVVRSRFTCWRLLA